jgi:alpha-tubulin suppressor-like RCC1 family protein
VKALVIIVLLVGSTACVIESLGLDGHACPCLDGYICDDASNRCIAAPTDAGVDASLTPLVHDLALPETCVAAASAGWSHTCVLKKDGTVWCWGNNNAGQSRGDQTVATVPVPTAVPGVAGATMIAAGDSYTCALVSGGAVLCWGYNNKGQLGIGPITNASEPPTSVAGLTGATQVAAAFEHTCALKSDGTVVCWGGNESGQLGTGDTMAYLTPVAVPSLSGVTQVAVGWAHSCALKNDGSVVCWGDNTYGQLGDATMTSRSSPGSNVQGLSDAAALFAAFYQSCVIRRDGTVYCWGLNSHGELGDGTMTNKSMATKTKTMTNTVALGIGGYNTIGPLTHACAVGSDGSVWCWGDDAFGELGDAMTLDRDLPNQVAGVGAASAIAVGGKHTCAVVPGAAISCWGANNVSQLGNNSTTESHVPVDSQFVCP